MQSVSGAMFVVVASRILSGYIPPCLMIMQMNNLQRYNECLNFLVHEILFHINHQVLILKSADRACFC